MGLFLTPYTTIWEWLGSKTQWLFFFFPFNSMTSWLFFFFKPWQDLLEFRCACQVHMMRIVTVLTVSSLDFILTIESSTFRVYRQPYGLQRLSMILSPNSQTPRSCPLSIPRCAVSQHYSVTQLALLCRNWFPLSFLEFNKWFLLSKSSPASVFLWTLKSLVTNNLRIVPIRYCHCINMSNYVSTFFLPPSLSRRIS